MSTTVISRRSLTALAALVVVLFAVSGAIAAIWGQHPDNDVVDAIGAVAWFGFLGSAVLLLVLCLASLAVRVPRPGR